MRQWQADACKLQGGLHSADDDSDHPMRRGAPDTGKSASRKPPQLATTTDGAAAKVAAVEELSSLAGVLELEAAGREGGGKLVAEGSEAAGAGGGSREGGDGDPAAALVNARRGGKGSDRVCCISRRR